MPTIEPFTFGSLFAGIGGLDLGLERAGMTCAWQVEIDPWARRVLAKHWPGVRRWDDVRTFPPDTDSQFDSQSTLSVDLICGGFPCTDISCAGKRAGLAGKQSGLWHEFARIVRVLRPRYILVENVSALLTRGLDAVLGTLAADGYDAEWACIPAASLGAPHIRDRVFVVAHSRCEHGERWGDSGILGCKTSDRQTDSEQRERIRQKIDNRSETLSHSISPRLEERSCFRGDARTKLQAAQRANREAGGQWAIDPAEIRPESGVGGMVDGISARMDGSWKYTPRVASGIHDRTNRLRGLGNAVVPQVAEFIGRRILEFHRDPRSIHSAETPLQPRQ